MLVLALKFSSCPETTKGAPCGTLCRLHGSKRSQKTEQRDYPNVRDSASGLESLGLTAADRTAMTRHQRGSRQSERLVS